MNFNFFKKYITFLLNYDEILIHFDFEIIYKNIIQY